MWLADAGEVELLADAGEVELLAVAGEVELLAVWMMFESEAPSVDHQKKVIQSVPITILGRREAADLPTNEEPQ